MNIKQRIEKLEQIASPGEVINVVIVEFTNRDSNDKPIPLPEPFYSTPNILVSFEYEDIND